MKSAALASQVIDKALGGADFTPPSDLWVSLYTTAPTEDGGGVEVGVNGYSRVQVPNDLATWPAASSGNKANAVAIQFPAPTGPWGTIVAFGLHTDPTADALYMYGVFDESFAVDAGGDPRFGVGELAVEET